MSLTRRTIQTSLAVLVLSCGVSFAVLQLSLMQVSSGSMEYSLHDGDYLLVERVSTDQLKRGQVIVFRSPANSKEIAVKRVIGIPGDHVSIQKGSVILNGTELEETYAHWEQGYNSATYYWPVDADMPHSKAIQVPEASYFVLGDNRAMSFDSRHFGAVSRRNVIGVVIWTKHRRE